MKLLRIQHIHSKRGPYTIKKGDVGNFGFDEIYSTMFVCNSFSKCPPPELDFQLGFLPANYLAFAFVSMNAYHYCFPLIARQVLKRNSFEELWIDIPDSEVLIGRSKIQAIFPIDCLPKEHRPR
jgi:hypothetical protein